MDTIKGSKEYIYLRLKDKFDEVVDMPANNIVFNLLNESGDKVLSNQAVDKIEYTDEEDSGSVYRFLLDTTTLPKGNYTAEFNITNGDEFLIKREALIIA